MANEPTPPPSTEEPGEAPEPEPEQETEVREEPERPNVYPFVDAAAGGGPGITIRAGWADQESGDPRELVVNYNGSAGSPTAEAAYEAALEWYRDTVSALVKAERANEQAESERSQDAS